jgi:hypothetical protein
MNFFHSTAPWAVSADVRNGIHAMHHLEQANEELQIIQNEVARLIAWAV